MTAKRVFVLVLLLWAVFAAVGETGFSGLDLSGAGSLLFKGTTDAPGFGSYDTLFLTGLGGTAPLRQLSFFPEIITVPGGSSGFQIQNRYGLFRSNERFENLSPVTGFPSFASGSDISLGKLSEIGTSPDGRYLAYLESTSSAYGDLYLTDMTNGKKTLVSRKLEITGGSSPVRWSPDGDYFVFSRERTLYYYSIGQLQEKRVLDEAFRSLGAGILECVAWNSDGSLYQVSGELVWRIRTTELFTGSLYTGFMKAGSIVGRLPFNFDPNFDSFTVSPDGKKILFNKGGKNLFLYVLKETSTGGGSALNLPYLLLPRNGAVRDILWSRDDVATVLVGLRLHGEEKISVYRLNASSEAPEFTLQKDEGVKAVTLSRDGATAAVLSDSGVLLRDYRTWDAGKQYAFRKPLHAVWTQDRKLLVAGAETIELLDPEKGTFRFIALSQTGEYGFAPDSDTVRVRLGDRTLDFDPVRGVFGQAKTNDLAKPSTASEKYRVYLEQQTSGSYRNIVMVRDIKSMGTRPLFAQSECRYEPFPDTDDPSDPLNFTHGSRIRRREVALVFDAIDSSEGLLEVLSTLSNYGIKATFFVNGEFIRRYPDAVKEIAESGHEVGSMFSSYFDMTDERFKVDDDFVKKGLARNEDEYFLATGKELSLFWHAPYYFVNSGLVNAAAGINYTYTGRDVDTLDWVSSEDKGVTGDLYYRSSELIERIMKLKKPGSILPVRVGRPVKGREDYLFQKIDLLINNLVIAGYTVVPVSTLVDHAK